MSDPTPGPSYGAEGEQPANPYGPPASQPPPNPYAAPEPGQAPPYGSEPYAQPGYPQPGYPQPGYQQSGYPQPGYPQQPGYPPAGGPGYPAGPYGYQVPPPNDGGATAAMIVGIVSLVLACGYGIGLLGAPVALVMGRRSMKRIDASNGTLGGRGMALAGFVMGIIGTIFLVLALIAVGIIVAVGLSGGFDSGSSYDGSSF